MLLIILIIIMLLIAGFFVSMMLAVIFKNKLPEEKFMTIINRSFGALLLGFMLLIITLRFMT